MRDLNDYLSCYIHMRLFPQANHHLDPFHGEDEDKTLRNDEMNTRRKSES